MSPSARAQRVWDELCIRNLAFDYADSVLTKDGARMLSLWATDLPPVTPPDFDVNWARKLPARWASWKVTLLHVTTHAIRFDGPDHAHGRVQCIVQTDQDEGFIDQSVVYEDDYVRRGDGWVFAIRRHRLWFGLARPKHPLDQAESTWPRSQLGAGTLPEDMKRLWDLNEHGS
jgi:hypothetical protein